MGASHLFAAHGGNVRVGIARDPAFCHYFRDNLLALERAGAELVPFSPVAGDPLPSNCKGLLFGGGYPELYARELANNRGLRAARDGVRRRRRRGVRRVRRLGVSVAKHG